MINNKKIFIWASLGIAIGLSSFDATAVKPKAGVETKKSKKPVGKPKDQKPKAAAQKAKTDQKPKAAAQKAKTDQKPKAAAPRTDTIVLTFGQALDVYEELHRKKYSTNGNFLTLKEATQRAAQIRECLQSGEAQAQDPFNDLWYNFGTHVLASTKDLSANTHRGILRSKENHSIEAILRKPIKPATQSTKAPPKAAGPLKLIPKPKGTVQFATEDSLKIVQTYGDFLYRTMEPVCGRKEAARTHPSFLVFRERLNMKDYPGNPFTLDYDFKERAFLTDTRIELPKKGDERNNPFAKDMLDVLEGKMLELLTLKDMKKKKAQAAKAAKPATKGKPASKTSKSEDGFKTKGKK